MADGVFTLDVLRINLSDRDQVTNLPSLGIKESLPSSSGHSTARIRSFAEESVFWAWWILKDFMLSGQYTRPNGRLGGSGDRADAQLKEYMTRRAYLLP